MRIKTKHFLLVISPLFFAVITLLFTFKVNSTVIIALVSSVLHECGHLVTLINLKCTIKSVTLSFYGMKIIRENEMRLCFKNEIIAGAAGVAVNFALALILFVLNLFIKTDILLNSSVVNLILGMFNSLPVYPLDGGWVVSCYLKERYDLVKSEQIIKTVSVVTFLPLFILGGYLFIFRGNFTLFICCVYLAVFSLFNL